MDVRDVWEGSEDPEWVMGLVDRVWAHPESVTRARIRVGDDVVKASKDTSPSWVHHFGYDETASRVDDLVDMTAGKTKTARRPKARQSQDAATGWEEASRIYGTS